LGLHVYHQRALWLLAKRGKNRTATSTMVSESYAGNNFSTSTNSRDFHTPFAVASQCLETESISSSTRTSPLSTFGGFLVGWQFCGSFTRLDLPLLLYLRYGWLTSRPVLVLLSPSHLNASVCLRRFPISRQATKNRPLTLNAQCHLCRIVMGLVDNEDEYAFLPKTFLCRVTSCYALPKKRGSFGRDG
jgi:hypothetical protein